MDNVHLRLMTVEPASGEESEWIAVIHAANKLEPGIFGRPTFLGEWWAGGSVEEYDDARVIHRTDPTVSIVSKTERGARTLRSVAFGMGIHIP